MIGHMKHGNDGLSVQPGLPQDIFGPMDKTGSFFFLFPNILITGFPGTVIAGRRFRIDMQQANPGGRQFSENVSSIFQCILRRGRVIHGNEDISPVIHLLPLHVQDRNRFSSRFSCCCLLSNRTSSSMVCWVGVAIPACSPNLTNAPH